ncbi:MAG: hypothetical protein NTW65_08940 [Deltaproteobacteria bacterium]|nr:hypothetical protein [Deltaproteobacteria bacterium]
MKIDDATHKAIQEHLGYTDEEMALFIENHRNLYIISKAGALMGKTIVFEVVESHGCNSQHKVGNKFYFDGAGNLITKLNPGRICCFALGMTPGLIFAAHELLYAGVDPNEMRFKRTGCFDTGVKCGGWGHIVMEIRVEDRKK